MASSRLTIGGSIDVAISSMKLSLRAFGFEGLQTCKSVTCGHSCSQDVCLDDGQGGQSCKNLKSLVAKGLFGGQVSPAGTELDPVVRRPIDMRPCLDQNEDPCQRKSLTNA